MVVNMAKKFKLLLLLVFLPCLMAWNSIDPSKAKPMLGGRPVSVYLHPVQRAAEFAVNEHNKKVGSTQLKLEKAVDARLVNGHITHSSDLVLVLAAEGPDRVWRRYVAQVGLNNWPVPTDMKLKRFKKI